MKSYGIGLSALFCLTLCGSCTGELSNGKTTETEPTGEGWTPKVFADGVAYSPTARLSKRRYARVVEAAFGTTIEMPELAADEAGGLTRHPEAPPLADYGPYVNGALHVGAQLAPGLVDACDFEADAQACTLSELQGALEVLYRGAVSTEDTGAVAAVIEEALAGGAQHAVTHGVALALLNPRFLYQLESGVGEVDSSGGRQLTEYELAGRLSFTAWHSAPDSTMFDLATEGRFTDEIGGQANRVFFDSETSETIWQFVRTWLRLGDPSVETDPLKLAMLEETKRFVQYVLVEERAPFEDLFTAKYSFIDAQLAAHYGVEPPKTDWERYEFPEDAGRFGVLTHGSFLSANTAHERDIAWIFRGKVVFEHLFCGEMPAPPPNVASQEVASRTETQPCASCHSAVDPMGQFFDRYDELGGLLPEGIEGGRVELESDIDDAYANVGAFVRALSESRAVSHCFVRHWFRAALGRELAAQDQESFDATFAVFEAQRSVPAMLTALAGTESFSTVYPKPFEAVCE